MAKRDNPRIALVIGSGGLKCTAAIGVMQVLEEEGIDLDMIVGCSGGAVIGGLFSVGISAEKAAETAQQFWTSEITRKVDIRSLLKIIFPKLFGFDEHIGIFDNSVLVEHIEGFWGATTTFADTRIPFYSVTTDLHTGKPIVLSEGKLARAIWTSASIPMTFRPVEWNGRLLMDGGLSNPLPVDVAIQAGADIIIAVGFESPGVPSLSSPGYFVMQMFNILSDQLLHKQFAFYNLAHHSEIILVVPEFKENIKVNDAQKIPYIIEEGKKEFQKHIGYLRQLLAS